MDYKISCYHGTMELYESTNGFGQYLQGEGFFHFILLAEGWY